MITKINQWILNIDSRVKLLSYIIFIVIIFLPIDNTGYIFLLAFFLVLSIFFKINWKRFYYIFINILIIYFIIQFFNMFFITEPNDISWGVAFNLGNIEVYWYSFYLSFTIAFRFFLLLYLALLFSSIMKLDEMAYTFRSLFSFLKYLKIPVDDLAIIFTIAIRFFPILKEETEGIFLAQRSRGFLNSKNPLLIISKYKYFGTAVRSLLLSLFEKADHLAIAMENRGYLPGKPRSYYEKHHFGVSNYFYLGIIFLILGFFIFMSVEGGDLIPRFGDALWWSQR